MRDKQVEKKDFDAYLDEARSWETDKVIAAHRSKRLAWAVACAATCLALVSGVAVAALTPLKTTELRIVRVDNTTGIVDVVTELPNGKTNYSEAVNKYFAQLYIRYREGYSRELAEEYYSNVGLMSANAQQRRYADFFTPKNPLSPLNVHGTTARVKVRVKSVSFIKDNVALVRYVKEIERGASERPLASHWAATVVFSYSGAPMTERDRSVNPLGFQVTEYRNDPDSTLAGEALPPPAPTSVPVASPAPVTILPGVPSARPQVPAIAP